jgi:multidrug efflux pump subunit AcrA (membrane-fusion protein)
MAISSIVLTAHEERALFGLEYKWIVFICTVFGTLMIFLDSTIVNIALPKITAVFGVSASEAQLVITAYLLAAAVVRPYQSFLNNNPPRCESRRRRSIAVIFNRPFRTAGTSVPKEQITVLPKATGRVQCVLVDVGDAVHTGDLLAELEQDTPSIQLAQARANLEAAQAKLVDRHGSIAGESRLSLMRASAVVKRQSMSDCLTLGLCPPSADLVDKRVPVVNALV